ncbi:hypothetical protein [Helicovermis profundi]|uniref:Uncharacterized protein n=1 Tax=Helicovermis profundi TaxID=3065157 RepID=A0AAU9EQR8_9FIRM|nr:hypothetical protein HLPR_20520 [Clostridia bacterium S502]
MKVNELFEKSEKREGREIDFDIESMRFDCNDLENIEDLAVPGGSGFGCDCKGAL